MIEVDDLNVAPFLLRLLSQPNEASARKMMGSLGIGTTSDQVIEGVTNLFFTSARVLAVLAANNYATQAYVGAAIAALPATSSGFYTPTLTNVANVAASAANECQWSRIGNIVTVGGSITVDPTTASVLTEVGISLPVASAFTASDQLGGVSACGGAARSGQILADAANDRAQFLFTPVDVANRTQAFTFSYRVL